MRPAGNLRHSGINPDGDGLPEAAGSARFIGLDSGFRRNDGEKPKRTTSCSLSRHFLLQTRIAPKRRGRFPTDERRLRIRHSGGSWNPEPGRLLANRLLAGKEVTGDNHRGLSLRTMRGQPTRRDAWMRGRRSSARSVAREKSAAGAGVSVQSTPSASRISRPRPRRRFGCAPR